MSNGYNFFTNQVAVALVYINDILIFSRNKNQHVWRTHTTLPLLHKPCATLHLQQHRLFRDKSNYLGHIIALSQLKFAGHTPNAICHLKTPNNIAKLSCSLVYAISTSACPEICAYIFCIKRKHQTS